MSISPYLYIDETAPVNAVCERESDHQGVTLKYLRYFSHAIGEFPLEMAAILAVPSAPGPHPALLHLHGGAQCAKADIALAWAKRGYVTLCPDWSVPANVNQAAHATRWPENIPPTHASLLEAGDATIGHIVRGVRHGISLLAALPEVQADRIGMVGISWGGLMTWLVNGSDTRLRTAIAVYGSGRTADHPMSDSWRANFQPESVASTQHAPILHLNGTHDFFGQLDTSEALLQKVGPKARRLYVPNEDHGLSDTARRSAWAWLELHLRGDGTLPPEPAPAPAPGRTLFHAPHAGRTAVWRQAPADTLPASGRFYINESHPNGLVFSSAVRHLGESSAAPRTRIWDAQQDGLNGFFLRWELGNLQVHAPAAARLSCFPDGVGPHPARSSFCVFLRTDAALSPQANALCLTLRAPPETTVNLSLFTTPEIDEAHRWLTETQRCTDTGPQKLVFPLDSFRNPSPDAAAVPPDRIRVLRIEITSSQTPPPDFRLLSITQFPLS